VKAAWSKPEVFWRVFWVCTGLPGIGGEPGVPGIGGEKVKDTNIQSELVISIYFDLCNQDTFQ
jgi:hypothetical protein